MEYYYVQRTDGIIVGITSSPVIRDGEIVSDPDPLPEDDEEVAAFVAAFPV